MKGDIVQKYIIGLITGIFFTASFFMLIGAKKIQDHTHDTSDITYSQYGYAGYGTLKKKIKDIDNELDDLSNHTHLID